MCNSVNPDYNIKTRKQGDGVRFLLLLKEFNISNQCWLQEPCSGGELGVDPVAHDQKFCIFLTNVSRRETPHLWLRELHIFNQCLSGERFCLVAERVTYVYLV